MLVLGAWRHGTRRSGAAIARARQVDLRRGLTTRLGTVTGTLAFAICRVLRFLLDSLTHHFGGTAARSPTDNLPSICRNAHW